MQQELNHIVCLVKLRTHLECIVAKETDIYRLDMLEEQLHECKCAIEHVLNAHTSNDLVCYDPFTVSDDDFILALAG